MVEAFNNIHPELTCSNAYQILKTPIDQLESKSDLYTAAAHLINFPGNQTEQILLDLLVQSSSEQAVRIAKRKAVEVLARLGATQSVSVIGQCLESDDIYLVENSVWALQQLKCCDPVIIRRMISLLEDKTQNLRVLIQCLASLRVQESIESIRLLQDSESLGVRGAAISAIAQFTNNKSDLDKIAEHLTLPNQMDRQSAVQDLIDSNASDFLPEIVAAPVSPAFRMRACRQILIDSDSASIDSTMLPFIDTILCDDPSNINIIHEYDQQPSADFLLQDLFNTDFSRCYLSMKSLRQCSSEVLWPLMSDLWEREAHNDYGAHYFFMRIFGSRSDWPQAGLRHALEIIQESIINCRPQFRKSRAAAIQALHFLSSDLFINTMPDFLSESVDAPWDCRYMTVMCIENMAEMNLSLKEKILSHFMVDSDVFVRARSEICLSRVRELSA